MSLNKVLLIGNVGKTPEVRYLESVNPDESSQRNMIASFTLATSQRYKSRTGQWQESTEWHNIVCWKNLAEIVDKYVGKGSQLFIEGHLRTRFIKDAKGNSRSITEVIADNLQLLDRKADGAAQAPEKADGPLKEPEKPADSRLPMDNDGDLPF